MAEPFQTEKEKRVLAVDLRRTIYTAVKKHAGAHFREIERQVNLATGTVQYHLDFLEKNGLITTEKDGKNLRYFPQDFVSEDKQLLSVLRQATMRNIVLHILQNNECNHEHIVKQLQKSPSTISWHLKKLVDSNIIRAEKIGRESKYAVQSDPNQIIKILITYQDSFLDTIVDNIVDLWELN